LTEVICDLDGVLYRGDTPVGGSPEALARLMGSGVGVTFVTNNSTKSPSETAAKISRITGVEVDGSTVVTSSMAAASMLGPSDAPALAVGEPGVTDALVQAGVELADNWRTARSVVVGMDWGITYEIIANASGAVRLGARFVATNNDPTFPTADRLLPGAGAVVAAIATASGQEPEVAGKPHQPIRDLLGARGIGDAWVIGDRLDTDIALASDNPNWRSILVMTGVTGAGDDVGQADNVVADFDAAVDLILAGGR
jgi:4-nitrophenyl phosphatase